MANFPASLDNGSSLPTPAAGNNTNSPSHAGLHGAENAAIIATETKLGTGATTPAANQLLVGTGAGTSAWQGLTSAQLAAILSDETGSGAAVFANTPTLITPKVDTINESTPGNGVTVGGVNLKSGVITTAGAVGATAIAAGAVGATAIAAGIQLPDKTKNPYKFRVYRNTAWNTASGTWGKIALDTKVFDTGSNFDAVTNFRFVAPIAGFYWFSGRYEESSAGNISTIGLYKNGVLHSQGDSNVSTAFASASNNVSDIIQLAATDFVELWQFTDGARTGLIGSAFTYLSGFLVSAT